MKSTLFVPHGWQRIKVMDISLRIHYGYTASSVKKNTGVKLLRITDIKDYKVEIGRKFLIAKLPRMMLKDFC